nr:MAG TPA: hypothetical protein [Caudoviricetes sp.]
MSRRIFRDVLSRPSFTAGIFLPSLHQFLFRYAVMFSQQLYVLRMRLCAILPIFDCALMDTNQFCKPVI